jgi:hypothetical protein
VIVLEEAVVEMNIGFHRQLYLVKALWNITFRVQIFGPDLSDMKVNQVAVVTVKLKQFIALKTSCVDIVLDINVLVGQDVVRLSVFVTWSVDVVNFEICTLFGLIHCEVKVFTGDYFLIGSVGELFLVKLVFKVLEHKFLLNDLVDLGLDLLDFWDVRV